MPRLFTGLEIPPEIGAALAALRGGIPGARWIEPQDYHITLRFVGDVSEQVMNEWCAELAQARPREPIGVTLDGLSSFGGDTPRAVLARATPTAELADLQAEHERIARRIGA